jgi:hypothetical protein
MEFSILYNQDKVSTTFPEKKVQQIVLGPNNA